MKNVLIVENSGVLCERLQTLLTLSGRYKGHACADGERLALAAIESTAPDAALVDLRLKEGSGFGLLTELRSRGRTLPVVLLSQSQGKPYTDRARRMGATALLCKSTQFQDIVPTLDRLLAQGPPAAYQPPSPTPPFPSVF